MEETDWLIPAFVIVTGLIAVAAMLTAVTGYSSPPPWESYLVIWPLYGLILGGVLALVFVARMALNKEDDPLARLGERVIGTAPVSFLLAGLVLIGFSWTKPQLAMLTGFRFDEIFAGMDAAIFGADAWKALAFLLPAQPFLDWVYSLWFPALILSLALVSIRGPSVERSTALLSYFALWGVFGPLGQLLLPAAGPIFYERIGLGPRFAELVSTLPYGSANAGNYLWERHTGQVNDLAVGISAMPSMHVAMAFWIVLAFHRSKLAPLALAYFAAVFLGSILLAWHYFVDGLAGCAGALLCWKLSALWIERRSHAVPTAHNVAV